MGTDMARKRKKAEPNPGESTPNEGPEGRGMSKMDAVRKALADGIDKPADGVAYIKQQFGIDIPNQVFSSYKSQLRARAAGGNGGGPSPRGRRTPGKGDPVEAARRVKELVDEYGADTVRGFVDLFAR